jgi:hypothetical protein
MGPFAACDVAVRSIPNESAAFEKPIEPKACRNPRESGNRNGQSNTSWQAAQFEVCRLPFAVAPLRTDAFLRQSSAFLRH